MFLALLGALVQFFIVSPSRSYAHRMKRSNQLRNQERNPKKGKFTEDKKEQIISDMMLEYSRDIRTPVPIQHSFMKRFHSEESLICLSPSMKPNEDDPADMPPTMTGSPQRNMNDSETVPLLDSEV